MIEPLLKGEWRPIKITPGEIVFIGGGPDLVTVEFDDSTWGIGGYFEGFGGNGGRDSERQKDGDAGAT
jgi:hypothetical protein